MTRTSLPLHTLHLIHVSQAPRLGALVVERGTALVDKADVDSSPGMLPRLGRLAVVDLARGSHRMLQPGS